MPCTTLDSPIAILKSHRSYCNHLTNTSSQKSRRILQRPGTPLPLASYYNCQSPLVAPGKSIALQYAGGALRLYCFGRMKVFDEQTQDSEGKANQMADQPPSDRFKAEMPEIPGVAGAGANRGPWNNPAVRLVSVLLVVLVGVLFAAKWALRPRHTEPPVAEAPPTIEVPSPAPDPNAALPHATEANPGIATLPEMAQPWSSKQFFMRNGLTSENVPALLVRLPTSSASQTNGYWAFSLNSPYGNCRLEYLTDLAKLKNDYDFRSPKHPMVGNPCSRTVFDPLKLTNLPGDVWVRGAIVQGSDLRPPIGIELKIERKDILAIRME